MRLRSVFFAVTCVSWVFVQGCGDDTSVDDGGSDGTVNDVVQQNDTGNDVVTVVDTGTDDTGTDAGTTDGSSTDASDGATQQDTGIGTWQCGSVTVSSCSQCIGFQQPCAYCLLTDASVLSGVCTQPSTNCLNAIPQGYQDCPCADAAACPEAFQVCTQQGRCHTCTDNANNNTLKCENGGTCSADAGCL